jgi:hypothetical protein
MVPASSIGRVVGSLTHAHCASPQLVAMQVSQAVFMPPSAVRTGMPASVVQAELSVGASVPPSLPPLELPLLLPLLLPVSPPASPLPLLLDEVTSPPESPPPPLLEPVAPPLDELEQHAPATLIAAPLTIKRTTLKASFFIASPISPLSGST